MTAGRVAVTGSIASDNLAFFPGRFSEQILPEQLDRLSLSFLVDDLQVKRGGIGPNIAYGIAQFGLKPVLVGAAGRDFEEYRNFLEAHSVDCSGVRISPDKYTARFFCTTDLDNCQIASFYAGAMADARHIELAPLGSFDLIVVSPNDPEAMARHTAEAKAAGIPFVSDPSQQLARMDGDGVTPLVEGAEYLFVNDYELGLICQKTGWNHDDVLSRVEVLVTTFGADGALIERRDGETVKVKAVPEEHIADPTGVGDGFRAGFLAGVSRGLGLERCAQIGSLLATYVLEEVGSIEYEVDQAGFAARFTEAFGGAPAEDLPQLFGP